MVQISLLRSRVWVAEQGCVTGRSINLSMPEMHLAGEAEVLSVDECPPIGTGQGRVITGTFVTPEAAVVSVRLSSGETLEATHAHPFYSDDRADWVAAKDLRIGERLRSAGGQVITVLSVAERAGSDTVYNLEVDAEHHYYVAECSVLVHNACASSNGPNAGEGVADGKITGYTRHGLNQVIGRDGGAGVKPGAILGAAKNPQQVIQQAGGKIKYIGKDATVVTSAEGKVITSWPHGAGGVRGE